MLLFHHTTYDEAASIVLNGFLGDETTCVLVSNDPMPGDGQEWGEVVLELHTTLRGLHLEKYTLDGGTAKSNGRLSYLIPVSILNPHITAIHPCGSGDTYRHSLKTGMLHGPRRPPRAVAELYPGIPMRHIDAWLPAAIAGWLDEIAETEGQTREEVLTRLAGDAIRLTYAGELLAGWEHPQPIQTTEVFVLLADPES